MPPWVQPLSITSDKQLSETTPPCVLRTTRLEHDLKAPIEHDDIAKSLRLCFWKRQTDESTSSFMKRTRSIKDLGAVCEGTVVHVDADELLWQALPAPLHSPIEKRPPRRFARDQHLRIDRPVCSPLQTGPGYHRREQRDPEHASRGSHSPHDRLHHDSNLSVDN